MGRSFLYPFTDRRVLKVALLTGLYLIGYLVLLMAGIGLGAYLKSEALVVLGSLLSTAWLFVYVGYMVAATREGVRSSHALPAFKLGAMTKDGLAVILFVSLSTMAPMFGLVLTVMVSFAAIAGLTVAAAQLHEGVGLVVGLLGLGGVSLVMIAIYLLLLVCLTLLVPIMQARYAATSEISSFFRVGWAVRAILVAPGDYLLHQLPMIAFNIVLMAVHLMTFGLGSLLLFPLCPLVQLNHAYLTGHYYGKHGLS